MKKLNSQDAKEIGDDLGINWNEIKLDELKILAASCAESSIPNKEFYILCSLIPRQAAFGN